MIRVVTFGMGVLMAMPAMAQSVGEKTGINSLVGIAPTTQDFVTQAAQSDMFEIQSSEAGLNSSNPAVKSYAQQMIADHNKTTAELKAAVAGGVPATLPTAMTSSEQSMLTKLHGLKGTDFDSQYKTDQVAAHTNAVSLFQRYGNGGENPKLKTWAATTLPSLQHHLDMAQNLNK